MIRWRLAQRLDIADQVVDLGARQGEIRHRAMWVRQKRAQLVGRHSAAGYCGKTRRTLWNGAGGIAVDYMAIGAPLPRDLRALLGVGPGSVPSNSEPEAQYRQGHKALYDTFLLVIITMPGITRGSQR